MFTFNRENYRSGQSDGHDKIIDALISFNKEVLSRPTYIDMLNHPSILLPEDIIKNWVVPIILPTRYGKSDLMRMSSIEAIKNHLACLCIFLVPSADLRRQLFSEKKLKEMCDRYGINAGDIKYQVVKTHPRNPIKELCANGEQILVMTIQMANQMRDILSYFINHKVSETGLPVLLHIDEAHTGSDKNEWGATAESFAKNGAVLVLYTATPIRSDNDSTWGLQFTVEDIKDYRQVTVHPSPDKEDVLIVDIWEGEKGLKKLDLDWVYKKGVFVPFSEAWDENLLCRFTHVTIDVYDGKTILVDLSKSKSRQIIGKIVRDGVTVREGCRLFVEKLTELKKLYSEIMGIIFTGNDYIDEAGKKESDKHAKVIEKELRKIAPEFNILIATSSDENEGNINIDKARNGEGDILIVKTMGATGLDIPRAKVELDLSPIRTPVLTTQKMTRIATPYKGLLHSTLITPKDVLYLALFKKIVEEQGGSNSILSAEKIDSFETPKKERDAFEFHPDKAQQSEFWDSLGNQDIAILYPVVRQFAQAFPEITMHYTDNQIVERLTQTPYINIDISETPIDTTRELENLKGDIRELAKDITTILMLKRDGIPYSSYSRKIFQKIIITEVYPTGRVYAQMNGVKLEDIITIEEAKQMKRGFQRYKDDVEAKYNSRY